MKTCPVCNSRCFDDTTICYGCMHRFGDAVTEHETHAYDCCPRCKSGQIEVTERMVGEGGWAVEYLECNDCELSFEQHYQYVCTVGRWGSGEQQAAC